MNSDDKHAHAEDSLEDAPFLVIYNYRHSINHPPKPRLPRSLRYPPVQAHSIILTRKMAAEMEMKNHIEPKESKDVQMIPEIS